MRFLITLMLCIAYGSAIAASDIFPLDELAFIERMQLSGQSDILDQFGEPSEAMTVRNRDTGEIIGAIWHYHYLNTGSNGDYYKTTEIEFVDNRVVTVVFSNSDYDDGNPPIPSNVECTQTC